jgi:hypothetical protein
MFAGQVIVGGILSTTVTVKVQLGPAAVVAVTVVVPFGKNEPDAGLSVTGPQRPVVVGAGKVTLAPQTPGEVFTVILDGQVIAQGAPQQEG